MNLIDIIQMIAALGVIILLANFLLKKLNKFQQPSSQVIKIIERVQVSKSSSLCIVQIESDYLLMSISETSSDVIKTFTQEEKEAIQQRLAKKHQAAGSQWTDKVQPYSGQAISYAGTFIKNAKSSYTDFQKKGTGK